MDYKFKTGQRVSVDPLAVARLVGKTGWSEYGEVTGLVPGNGTPWYFVRLENGGEGAFSADELTLAS
jgi:hypothetical protein